MKYNCYHEGFNLSEYSFLITGGAGFIGSNIVEYLVQFKAKKILILDNLSTGYLENIKHFIDLPNVHFVNGDIRSYETCKTTLNGIDFVAHLAALGSVPRSINDPISSNEVNVGGFLNMMIASKEEKVKKFVYAASSSTYGDSQILPKREELIGAPLSPYAVTKYVNELYASVFSKVYGFNTVGLRYFNVFGPKQNVNGAYAAVIPLFISQMLNGESPAINGTGKTSRDFTFVSNVIQANIKAMFTEEISSDLILNIACGAQTTLLELVDSINQNLGTTIIPEFGDFRSGDVMHSLADISKAKKLIDYVPEVPFSEGVKRAISYFKEKLN